MSNTLQVVTWHYPVGPIILGSTQDGLARLMLPRESEDAAMEELNVAWDGDIIERAEPNQPAIAQLEEYFAGTRTEFNLKLDLQGSTFQEDVWQALINVPFGQTRSYGWVAETIGNPRSVRAVGGANHANPIPIIVPCHRIIGADGSLTGFGGGLPLKKALLTWEQEVLNHENPSLFDPAPLDNYWPDWRRRMA